MPKRVVYLLGSGATQGVIKHAENRSLLTGDIQDFIRDELQNPDAVFTDKIWNEIIKDDRDVEHLITVLDSQYKHETANQVRKYYRKAIVSLAGRLTNPLPNNLYTYLVDLHVRGRLRDHEQLTCFLSLNYEDILERSVEDRIPGVSLDYVIETDLSQAPQGDVIPVLKLHGSFNWVNSRPIGLAEMGSIDDEHTLWIPPGVDKKRENYPFNLLWGRAVEYIQNADVIRVLGCSLSRNDWGLIPVLYTAQSLSIRKGLKIELIDYRESVDSVVNNYRYLNFDQFIDLPEVRKYKPRGSELSRDAAGEFYSISNKNTVNIFESWLNAKIEFLYSEDGVMRDDLLKKGPASLVAEYYTNSQ
jgi:hypothetical protein